MIDKQAFEEQIEAKGQALYRVARSILRNDEDCRDALQECVLRAWAARHTLRDDAMFSTWVTRILINECRGIQRKRARQRLLTEAGASGALYTPAPDQGVYQALMALPEKLRLPLVLHHVEGYTLREIAAMLRVTVATVRGRVFRARQALRLELDDETDGIKEKGGTNRCELTN